MLPAVLHEQWLQRLSGIGLASKAASILEQARTATLFRVRSVSEANSLGRSRVGGNPDLPSGVAWPVGKTLVRSARRGFFGWGAQPAEYAVRPLRFLLQLDLSALAEGTSCDLPRTGLLSVFLNDDSYDPVSGSGWRLCWFEGTLSLKVRSNPDVAPYPAYGLSAEPAATWPESFAVSLTSKEEDKLRELIGDFEDGVIQVGGHARVIQNSMEPECGLLERGIDHSSPNYGAAWSAAEKAATGWTLLMQIGSLDDEEMMWGDGGSQYIWMRATDIAARKFDKSWLIMQCY